MMDSENEICGSTSWRTSSDRLNSAHTSTTTTCIQPSLLHISVDSGPCNTCVRPQLPIVVWTVDATVNWNHFVVLSRYKYYHHIQDILLFRPINPPSRTSAGAFPFIIEGLEFNQIHIRSDYALNKIFRLSYGQHWTVQQVVSGNRANLSSKCDTDSAESYIF